MTTNGAGDAGGAASAPVALANSRMSWRQVGGRNVGRRALPNEVVYEQYRCPIVRWARNGPHQDDEPREKHSTKRKNGLASGLEGGRRSGMTAATQRRRLQPVLAAVPAWVLCAEESTLKTRCSMASAQHARHIMRRTHSYRLQYGTAGERGRGGTEERTNERPKVRTYGREETQRKT